MRGKQLNFDEKFVALTEQLPGFGGFYLDGQKNLVVRMKEPARYSLSQVQNTLASALQSPALEQVAENIRVEKGAYSFAQLYAWKLRAHALLQTPGVTRIDADEVHNRVRITVEDANAARSVRKTLLDIDIPSEAVFIETGRRVAQAVDLRDHWYLVEGGFEIGVPVGNCTLGFIAYLDGQLGFVTNSHCTTIQGNVDGSQVYQDSYGNISEYIGFETVDPPFYSYGGDPAYAGIPGPLAPIDDGKLHRKSDASFIKSETTDVNPPVIAHTESRSRTNGSRTRDGGFIISDEAKSYEHVVGMELNKVGRTTGWTYGYVQSTCETIGVPGSNTHVLDCQHSVDAGVDGGDSGSPVFAWSGSGDDIALHGVLWGCVVDSGGNCISEFVYSPIDGIEDDLGALTTY